MYKLCFREGESARHALWRCKNAKDVWKKLDFFADHYKKQFCDFMELLTFIMAKGSAKVVAKSAVLSLAIGNRRIAILHNQLVEEDNLLINSVLELLSDYQAVSPCYKTST